MLRIMFAELLNATLCTFRCTSSAYVAAVENEPMVGARDEVLGYMADKSFFGFEWCFAVVGESDAIGYAEDVGIDSHSWLIETDGSDDVSSFATNAR